MTLDETGPSENRWKAIQPCGDELGIGCVTSYTLPLGVVRCNLGSKLPREGKGKVKENLLQTLFVTFGNPHGPLPRRGLWQVGVSELDRLCAQEGWDPVTAVVDTSGLLPAPAALTRAPSAKYATHVLRFIAAGHKSGWRGIPVPSVRGYTQSGMRCWQAPLRCPMRRR